MFLCTNRRIKNQCSSANLPQETMRKMIFLTNMIKNRDDLRPLMELVHSKTLERHRIDTNDAIAHIAPIAGQCRYAS